MDVMDLANKAGIYWVSEGTAYAHKDTLQKFVDLVREAPIDMVLHCPACRLQHIDAAEEPRTLDPESVWTNPPHRSHLCARCHHVWRPADVPTNGVEAVKTRGKGDNPIVSRAC